MTTADDETIIDLSVIIPVSERFDRVQALYFAYRHSLDDQGYRYEFIYVIDGEFSEVVDELALLQQQGEPIKIIQLAKWFGEATALTAGFDHAAGRILLTLPAYYQVEPAEIYKILQGLEQNDMVIGCRSPRLDSRVNQLQSRIFHGLLNFLADSSFHDLGCGVRGLRREVMNEVPIYGDQHRFFPMLARRSGFRVVEMALPQSAHDYHRRIYRPGVYLRRLLDILTVFFLVKFTKKPLRFFGLLGTSLFALGGFVIIYIIAQRLFFGMPLADRPALLLSSLMVVLGAQMFALGLIGELIIFTHANQIKEYTIEKIVEFRK